jgi:hypothetical protein
MMRRTTDGLALIFLCLAWSSPGRPQPVSQGLTIDQQAPDLSFVLRVKDGRTQFHLGEIIEMDEAFSSSASGKYLLLSLPKKINGGHSAEFKVTPGQNAIDRARDGGKRSAFMVLHANCDGVGVGGSFGGCADCDTEFPLKSSAIHFPYSLTEQFQITEPGHYVIQAEAANVVLAPLDLERSTPISLVSNTIQIDVVEDLAWSQAKLDDAVARFEASRASYVSGGWSLLLSQDLSPKDLHATMDLQWKMQSAAEIMRVLDTEDSLREIVKRYDGAAQNPDYYNHVLFRGIIQSKHHTLAIQLLADRMLAPDFSVSRDLIDQLTAMTLENQFPGALAEDRDSNLRFYPSARQILYDYILRLGKSLPNKNESALDTSLATFKTYAREDFCTGTPLILDVSFNHMIQLQSSDSESRP